MAGSARYKAISASTGAGAVAELGNNNSTNLFHITSRYNHQELESLYISCINNYGFLYLNEK